MFQLSSGYYMVCNIYLRHLMCICCILLIILYILGICMLSFGYYMICNIHLRHIMYICRILFDNIIYCRYVSVVFWILYDM